MFDKTSGTELKCGVRVRMYRPGIGDCFLLTFRSGSTENHVLIDCGVLAGTPNAKTRIIQIMNDVVKTTGGEVAALAATHEHWDHVSGFSDAKASFDHLKNRETWLAWTEDPNQSVVQEHKAQLRALTSAVKQAAAQMSSSASAYDRECGLAVSRALGFEGVHPDMLGTAGFSPATNDAMNLVVQRKRKDEQFLTPGMVLERDWLPGGIRIYVLGPPTDLKALKNMEGKSGETYEMNSFNTAATTWASAVTPSFGAGVDADRMRPFDLDFACPETRAKSLSKAMGSLYDRYQHDAWRRIDNDWLQSAAQFALQLDDAINNTSLVLAFELVQSGKVLLFAGDAQVGNWKSWQNLTFTVGTGAAQKKIMAQDLLARTVFYKVGHHGSGNATLPAALAAMSNPDLTAMISTDTVFAQDKRHWEMPAQKLKSALANQANNRVITAIPLSWKKPAHASKEAWASFTKTIKPTKLFVDYMIHS